MHSKYSWMFAPLPGRWVLWQIWLSSGWSLPDSNKHHGLVAVYKLRVQKEMGLWVFAFQLLLGNRPPPARSQTSYGTDLLKQLLGHRGGCIACTQTAAQYTEIAMAVPCKYTLHNGAATCDHTDSFRVLHRRFAPTLGTVEQNKHQNIIFIYIYLCLSLLSDCIWLWNWV